jgi:hypothetical protein
MWIVIEPLVMSMPVTHPAFSMWMSYFAGWLKEWMSLAAIHSRVSENASVHDVSAASNSLTVPASSFRPSSFSVRVAVC